MNSDPFHPRDEHQRERLVLTVEEAARVLGISRGLAYRLVATGELPCLRLGARRVVPRQALQALVGGVVVEGAATCPDETGDSSPTPAPRRAS
jgi:excisionase family DNA binding protein